MGHTEDMLGKYVDTYLRNWGLNGKILTVTVDNVKSNEVMIRYLRNMMSLWGQLCILTSIAQEVLVIPASTVASEWAFSIGGMVINDYRTRLTPKKVEVLISTQDWLKGNVLHLFSEDDLNEIHRLEKGKFTGIYIVSVVYLCILIHISNFGSYISFFFLFNTTSQKSVLLDDEK